MKIQFELRAASPAIRPSKRNSNDGKPTTTTSTNNSSNIIILHYHPSIILPLHRGGVSVNVCSTDMNIQPRHQKKKSLLVLRVIETNGLVGYLKPNTRPERKNSVWWLLTHTERRRSGVVQQQDCCHCCLQNFNQHPMIVPHTTKKEPGVSAYAHTQHLLNIYILRSPSYQHKLSSLQASL